jgi:hypothetical protein
VPLIPTDWKTADTIAAILTDRIKQPISAARVHKTIREKTQIRQDGTLARQRPVITFEPSGARHENPQWWYAPAVVEIVHGILTAPVSAEPVAAFRGVDGDKVSDDVVPVDEGGRRA